MGLGRSARAVALGCATAAGAGASATAEPLPSVACVAVLRSASSARLDGNSTRERERLEVALAACEDPLPALVRLLALHRRAPLPAEAHERLHARLAALVADPGYRLTLGVAEHLVGEKDLDPATLAFASEQLAARVGASGDRPEPAALRALANVFARQGRDPELVSTLEALRRIEPANDVSWWLAETYARLERWPELAALLRSLVQGGARHLRLAYLESLARAGFADDTIALLGQLEAEAAAGPIEGQRAFASVWVITAWRLVDAGRTAEAEALFRRAAALAPDLEAPRLALLHLYGSAEERTAHLSALETSYAAETNPNRLLQMGTDRFTSGDYETAYDLLRRAAPAFPDLEAAWFNLGMVSYHTKRFPEATTALGRAHELNPGRAASVFFRGLSHVALEQWRSAIDDLLAALALDPTRTLAHYHLAVGYARLGDLAAAERHRRLYDQSKGRP